MGTNKLFEDVKSRIDAVLAFDEITEPDNSDQNDLKRTGLRVVQHRRIYVLENFDSENTALTSAAPATEEEEEEKIEKKKMLRRCANMSQCILEALCVAAGMTASTKEYLSVESESLMIALIYVLRVFYIICYCI